MTLRHEPSAQQHQEVPGNVAFAYRARSKFDTATAFNLKTTVVIVQKVSAKSVHVNK